MVDFNDLNDDVLLQVIGTLPFAAKVRLTRTSKRLKGLVRACLLKTERMDTTDVFPARRSRFSLPAVRLSRLLEFTVASLPAVSDVRLVGKICSTDERPLIRDKSLALRSGAAPFGMLSSFMRDMGDRLRILEFRGCFKLPLRTSGTLEADLLMISADVNQRLGSGLKHLGKLEELIMIDNDIIIDSALDKVASENMKKIDFRNNLFASNAFQKLIERSLSLQAVILPGTSTMQRSCGLSPGLLQSIAGLRQLKTLDLSSYGKDSTPGVSGADLAHILTEQAQWGSLVSLNLTWNNLLKAKSVDFMPVIAEVRTLQELRIAGHNFKPSSLIALCELTQLEILSISDTNFGRQAFVTGPVLSQLCSSLPSLMVFDVGDVREVSDEHLMSLAQLSQLRELVLSVPDMSPVTMQLIGSCMPLLESFYLRSATKSITTDALLDFAGKTPRMKIFHLLNSLISDSFLKGVIDREYWLDIAGFDVDSSAVSKRGLASFVHERPRLQL